MYCWLAESFFPDRRRVPFVFECLALVPGLYNFFSKTASAHRRVPLSLL